MIWVVVLQVLLCCYLYDIEFLVHHQTANHPIGSLHIEDSREAPLDLVVLDLIHDNWAEVVCRKISDPTQVR